MGGMMSFDPRETAPVVHCPICLRQMRIDTVVTEDSRGDRIIYVCECGFDYHRTRRVETESRELVRCAVHEMSRA
jgi:hypothetical protein